MWSNLEIAATIICSLSLALFIIIKIRQTRTYRRWRRNRAAEHDKEVKSRMLCKGG